MKGFPIVLCLLFSLSSCSLLSSKRKAETSEAQSQEMIPKVQYDQLLAKYNELLSASQTGKTQEDNVASNSSNEFKPDLIDITDPKIDLPKPVNDKNPSIDLSSDLSGKKLSSSIDKIQNSLGKGPMSVPTLTDKELTEEFIEKQIAYLKNAKEAFHEQNYNEALSMFKNLEKSNVKQIKVQAKFYTAEIFFMQKNFDMAMQIYEEIISKSAFSGLVLKALGRVIVCAERLKLTEKAEQYNSLLHEIFEGA